jgi:hypothetical protein
MIVTAKHLSRRTMLRGAGVALGLPLLDAMQPALSAQTKSGAPCRMLINYLPNGMIMKDWTPKGEGAAFDLPNTLEPMAAHRDRILVLSGMKRFSRPGQNAGAGAHATCGATYLTGVAVRKNGGSALEVGMSVDQVAVNQIGKHTRFPSLELSCEDGRMVGSCDPPYSCVYNNTISWRSATTPSASEINPRALYERLFGAGDEDAATRARFDRHERSLLDWVLEDSRSLQSRLGPSDRHKLDEYMTSVRAVEQRLTKTESENQIVPSMERPASMPAELVDHLGLMYDMLLIAYQADLTRICTFMIGREGSQRTFREIGIPDAHHPITHHKGDPALIGKVQKINRYHVELFSRFVAKLAGTQDGDGTLLDHMMILYGAGMSDPNQHNPADLPTMMVGGANGRIKGGRHVNVPANTPVTNLYMSMLDIMGVSADHFGDSTGKLEGLTGLS